MSSWTLRWVSWSAIFLAYDEVERPDLWPWRNRAPKGYWRPAGVIAKIPLWRRPLWFFRRLCSACISGGCLGLKVECVNIIRTHNCVVGYAVLACWWRAKADCTLGCVGGDTLHSVCREAGCQGWAEVIGHDHTMTCFMGNNADHSHPPCRALWPGTFRRSQC